MEWLSRTTKENRALVKGREDKRERGLVRSG